MTDQDGQEKLILKRINDIVLTLKSMGKNDKVGAAPIVALLASEVVPAIAAVTKYSIARAEYADARLDELSDRIDELETPESQIHPEDAASLIAHLQAVGEFLSGLLRQAEAMSNATEGLSEVRRLLENNDACIQAVRDATVEIDEDDDGGEDEDEDGDEDDDDSEE